MNERLPGPVDRRAKGSRPEGPWPSSAALGPAPLLRVDTREVSRSRAKRGAIIVAAGLGAAAVVLAILLFVGGSSPDTPYGERSSPGEQSSGPPAEPARRFGQAVRLDTYLTTIDVRPLAFVRFPATATSSPGVGVDLVIRNVGDAPYRDQPLQAASVNLRNGGEADRVYEPVRGCPGPPEDTIRIAPGATERFCLPFEAGGRADLFVYAPESGLPGDRGAPQAAAWDFSG